MIVKRICQWCNKEFERYASPSALAKGYPKFCSPKCARRPTQRAASMAGVAVTKINMLGKRFGRLTVIAESSKRSKAGAVYWWVRCDCGSVVKVLGTGLRRRHGTRSCGCLTRDRSRERNQQNTKHGDNRRGMQSSLYVNYHGMKARCYRESSSSFNRYGARGISLDPRWLGKNGYENFRSWALTNGYKDGLVIHRLDNDGDYTPQNSVWVSKEEHRRIHNSTRNTRGQWVSVSGVTHG